MSVGLIIIRGNLKPIFAEFVSRILANLVELPVTIADRDANNRTTNSPDCNLVYNSEEIAN